MDSEIDSLLSFLGLAKKAGMLEAGDESVGTTAKAHGARLILLASDAAGNTVRRAQHFAEAGDCLCATLPADKDALGRAVGRASCAILALTDTGFAAAAAKKLAAMDAERYGALAERLAVKAARAKERRERKKSGERKK